MTRSAVFGVFAVFAVAHFLSNFVRSANAVIAGDLVRDVGIGPADLGLMTSLYFLGFAAAQLPLGAALDRYGARIVTPVLMLAAVAGSLAFGLGRDLATLAIGRALMGVGTAGILMGGLKALSGWFAPLRFAAVSGTLVAIGSSGSLLASTPLAWMAQAFGWRAVFVVGAALLALSAGAVAVWARSAPGVVHAQDRSEAGFGAVFRSPRLWRMAGMALATTGVTFAFQSLWAGPYLADGIGLGPLATGNVLLAFGVGVSVGYLILGALGERLGVGRTLFGAGVAFVAAQTVLATVPAAGEGVLASTFAVLGVSGATSALLFALARNAFPLALTGRAVTAVNLFMFTGGFALQWGLGLWLDAGIGGHGSLFALTAAMGVVAVAAFVPEMRRASSE
ncbi:MAG: MFS transporter [Trueperaceae bacterium]|nr:MFS transporter [Trueperaceae bacterium]